MLKHTKSGYFTQYGLSKLTGKVRGFFVIYNNYGPIHLEQSEDVVQSIKRLFNSNHSIWRYEPTRYEIEPCDKDLNYRYQQLEKEIKLVSDNK